MAYNVGDPAHVAVHNDLTAQVRAAAQRAGVTVTLPDEAHLGDPGHVTDHNLIVDALAVIAAAPAAASAVITGGTVTRAVGTDGKTYDFHAFTANDAGPVVTGTGIARVLIVGGAGGNGIDGTGGAGGYLDLTLTLEAGVSYPVVIGAGGVQGTYGNDGNDTYFGSIRAIAGGGGADSVNTGRNGGSGGGGSRAAASSYGKAILTYGRQGHDGATGWVGGPAGGAGGGGAGSTGWVRNDGQPDNGRGGEGKMWLDGLYYASAGNQTANTTVTAGQTPYGQNARANSGSSGGYHNTNSAAGVVIIAVEVAP